MPIKDINERNKYRRKIYKENSTYYVQVVRRRKRKIREWFDEYKSKLKCERCGENHFATIDFHHKNSKEKEKAIATLVADEYSPEKIEAEVKKCMVLCSNCHRKTHFENSNL